MRVTIVLGFLALILALRVLMGDPPATSFDSRFERADAKLQDLSDGIEEDLEGSRTP